jgi:acetate---CoA ligase (ADP-forming) subunit beta
VSGPPAGAPEPAGSGPTALSEWDSKALLGPALPRPNEIRATSREAAVDFAIGLDRVVAKASGVAHKTEGGLVRLDLDHTGVAACWQELADAGDGTVVVAEQLRADFELIAGGVRDPQFGPLVSLGFGGILAEVLEDVAFVLAPPEPGELEQAISRLRGARLFSGFRGRPGPDRAALTAIVDAISDLLLSDERVVEIDCNPILVCDGRPFVADALVVRR